MRNYLSKRNEDAFGLNFFDEVFEDFFKPMALRNHSIGMKTDLKEREGEYELLVDMPGYSKEDIALTLSNGYLTIEAKRNEKEQDSDNFIRRERSMSCSRSYYVGDNVTEEDIKAKYNNGTLNLIIPKKQKPLPEKKQIQID